MAAAITDLLTQATTNSRPSPTTVSSIRAAAGATLSTLALTGWPTGTAVHFITYKINTSGAKIAGSQIDMKGIVSGTTITNITIKAGSDVGNAIGDVVEASPTAAWANDVVAWGTAQHNQDGTHSTITATSINTPIVSTLSDTSIPLSTYRTNMTFDFVVSGGIWTADSVGSTRNASMTAIVVMINGQLLNSTNSPSLGIVTARAFTASKDTYIDILNTAGVGSIVYTEVTNNTVSPALAANSLRIGIIITGATTIATTGSVNQGQEDRVLPIASSIPYSVTDSLGNLICPRDPQRKILGYKQRITNFSTSSSSATLIPELTCPIIIPTGRKIEIDIFNSGISAGAVTTAVVGIFDTSVGGTLVNSDQQTIGASGYSVSPKPNAITTPTSTSKTYVGSLSNSGAIATTITASATQPSFIRIRLV